MDNNLKALESRRSVMVAQWRELETVARAAGNKVLEDHARIHAELLEDPPVKLGDMVATLTRALGIPPCDDCKKRQSAMNSSRGFIQTVKGIFLSFLS